MPYVRAGTISEEPGTLQRVLDLPSRIYQFIVFFFMTLIDPAAAKKASQMARSSGSTARTPAGMRNVRGGGGNMPPMGG